MFKMPVLYNNTKKMLSMFGGRCFCNMVSSVAASFIPGGPIVNKVLSLAAGSLASSVVPIVVNVMSNIFSSNQVEEKVSNQHDGTTMYQKAFSALKKLGYEKMLPAIVNVGINKLVIDNIVPAGTFKLDFENLPSISSDEVNKLILVTTKDLISQDISQRIVRSTGNLVSSIMPS